MPSTRMVLPGALRSLVPFPETADRAICGRSADPPTGIPHLSGRSGGRRRGSGRGGRTPALQALARPGDDDDLVPKHDVIHLTPGHRGRTQDVDDSQPLAVQAKAGPREDQPGSPDDERHCGQRGQSRVPAPPHDRVGQQRDAQQHRGGEDGHRGPRPEGEDGPVRQRRRLPRRRLLGVPPTGENPRAGGTCVSGQTGSCRREWPRAIPGCTPLEDCRRPRRWTRSPQSCLSA